MSETKPIGPVIRANVERLLEEREMTLLEFCAAADTFPSSYYRTVGEASVRTGTIQRWADALGVPMSELMKENDA